MAEYQETRTHCVDSSHIHTQPLDAGIW